MRIKEISLEVTDEQAASDNKTASQALTLQPGDRLKALIYFALASLLLYLFWDHWLKGAWKSLPLVVFSMTLLNKEWQTSFYILASSLMFGVAQVILSYTLFWSAIMAMTWPLSWFIPIYRLSNNWLGADWTFTLALTLPLCLTAFIHGKDKRMILYILVVCMR